MTSVLRKNRADVDSLKNAYRYRLSVSSKNRYRFLIVRVVFRVYCNLVWSLSHATTKLDRIYKLQKKFCRLITFSNFTAPSRPLFQHLSILSVYDKYKYQLLIHVFKSSHNLIPNYYSCQYYIKNSTIHQCNTRQKNNLHIPKCRTCLRQNTIIYQGPKLWNALPDGIKSSKSLNIFKKQLRHTQWRSHGVIWGCSNNPTLKK